MEHLFFLFHTALSGHAQTYQILLVLMVLIWTTGRIFHALRLPGVLGEILAGVAIGPAMLGMASTHTETITILAELGVFFLMFHAGLDTDPREIFPRMKLSIATAFGGMAPIIALSALVATATSAPLPMALFLGTVLSINSLPVILSVLRDAGLEKQSVGHTVVGSSVANEIASFVIISVLLSAAKTGVWEVSALAFVLVKVLLFFVGTLFIGKRILPWFSVVLNHSGMKGFSFALIVALAFGLFAEAIGISAVLGAYLAGMFVREEITNEAQFAKIEDRLFGISYSFLGPIFFASIGMMISFSALWERFSIILLLAFIVLFGQIGGSAIAARALGEERRDALLIGAGLLGRGGTEVVVAALGAATISATTQQPLLSTEWFSVVVAVVALVTLIMPFAMKFFAKISR